MTRAEQIMRQLNPHAQIVVDGGVVHMFEDTDDTDGRLYALEVQSTPCGQHANAWVRFNPWGSLNGGKPYTVAHVDSGGFICLGDGATHTLAASPFDVRTAVLRSRFWCAAFSVLMETGTFPDL